MADIGAVRLAGAAGGGLGGAGAVRRGMWMRVTLDQLDSWCLHCSHLTRYQRSRFLARRAADHCAAVVGRCLTQLPAEAELQAVRKQPAETSVHLERARLHVDVHVRNEL